MEQLRSTFVGLGKGQQLSQLEERMVLSYLQSTWNLASSTSIFRNFYLVWHMGSNDTHTHHIYMYCTIVYLYMVVWTCVGILQSDDHFCFFLFFFFLILNRIEASLFWWRQKEEIHCGWSYSFAFVPHSHCSRHSLVERLLGRQGSKRTRYWI